MFEYVPAIQLTHTKDQIADYIEQGIKVVGAYTNRKSNQFSIPPPGLGNCYCIPLDQRTLTRDINRVIGDIMGPAHYGHRSDRFMR
jgi:hypothetical protein